jgi:hypothetical protein
MKRTTIWLSDEQQEQLNQLAASRGVSFSETLRRAIDWYLSTTVYLQDTDEMLEELHPDMTPEQLVGWLKFRWRLRYEGKEKNGNSESILQEILEIARRLDAKNT